MILKKGQWTEYRVASWPQELMTYLWPRYSVEYKKYYWPEERLSHGDFCGVCWWQSNRFIQSEGPKGTFCNNYSDNW